MGEEEVGIGERKDADDTERCIMRRDNDEEEGMG